MNLVPTNVLAFVSSLSAGMDGGSGICGVIVNEKPAPERIDDEACSQWFL